KSPRGILLRHRTRCTAEHTARLRHPSGAARPRQTTFPHAGAPQQHVAGGPEQQHYDPDMTLVGELSDCLGDLLGTGAPEAPDDSDEPFRFFRQWLAERNLGLVPIADPSSFDWAGKWIAVIDGSAGRHAVVMFGSPSGVWLDPANAHTDDARIVAGWMLTPLDL